MAELTAITGNRDEEMVAVLEKAKAKIPECDTILVLMSYKKGGLYWEALDEMQLQTAVYMALSLIVGIMENRNKK